MSHVVIAPDKFKGTLTAAQVAAHVAAGLKRARPGTDTVQVPIADGGDGTIDAAEAAGYRKIEIGVRGPTGSPVTAAFAFSDGTAVIEAAQACGLSRLPGGTLAPLTASSRGVGELILAAARMRAKRVVLGLGGVATTDGGSGMIRAFGAKLVDEEGADLPPGGAALARLSELDLSRMRDLSSIEFIVASDVNNPLLGDTGAAAIYAPQKGASPEDVTFLEEGLVRWAGKVEQALGTTHRDAPGAGAAGGLGFAALAFLRATVQSGIELMLDLVSFPAILDDAALVITGEGALDAQTLHGKAPAGVARATAAAKGEAGGVPVVAIAGQNELTADQLHEIGLTSAYALTDLESDVDRCRADAGRLVESVSEQIARDWLPARLPAVHDYGFLPTPPRAGTSVPLPNGVWSGRHS
jgi:glycerate kinase